MSTTTLTVDEKDAARKAAKAQKERERRARIKAEKDAASGATAEAAPTEAEAPEPNGRKPREGGTPAEIAAVLEAEGGPLHVKVITERVLARGVANLKGKTPQATIAAMLSVDSRKAAGIFRKVDRGTFTLR